MVFEVEATGVRLRPRRGGAIAAFAGASRRGAGKTVEEIVAEVRALRAG